jgi:Tat protein secretion system quality control protein TatD with DNase activity
MFIDTHSHLYLGELQHHIPEAIQTSQRMAIFLTSYPDWDQSRNVSDVHRAWLKEYDIIRATVGVHPCEAQDIDTVEEIHETDAHTGKPDSRKKKLI